MENKVNEVLWSFKSNLFLVHKTNKEKIRDWSEIAKIISEKP